MPDALPLFAWPSMRGSAIWIWISPSPTKGTKLAGCGRTSVIRKLRKLHKRHRQGHHTELDVDVDEEVEVGRIWAWSGIMPLKLMEVKSSARSSSGSHCPPRKTHTILIGVQVGGGRWAVEGCGWWAVGDGRWMLGGLAWVARSDTSGELTENVQANQLKIKKCCTMKALSWRVLVLPPIVIFRW